MHSDFRTREHRQLLSNRLATKSSDVHYRGMKICPPTLFRHSGETQGMTRLPVAKVAVPNPLGDNDEIIGSLCRSELCMQPAMWIVRCCEGASQVGNREKEKYGTAY